MPWSLVETFLVHIYQLENVVACSCFDDLELLHLGGAGRNIFTDTTSVPKI